MFFLLNLDVIVVDKRVGVTEIDTRLKRLLYLKVS